MSLIEIIAVVLGVNLSILIATTIMAWILRDKITSLLMSKLMGF